MSTEKTPTTVPVDPVVMRVLTAGFEAGDGSMDGAMLCYGRWWHPKFGCDSLQVSLDWLRSELWHGALKKLVKS